MRYAAEEDVPDTAVLISFHSQNGDFMCELSTQTQLTTLDLPEGEGVVEFRCSELGLQPGKYYIDTAIADNDWQVNCATLPR